MLDIGQFAVSIHGVRAASRDAAPSLYQSMSNVLCPVLHCPTRADRAAALTRLHAAGIYLAGQSMNHPLGNDWENLWGATYHHIAYCPDDQGVIMMMGILPLSSYGLTLANSADHFISYVRRHKLPLKS